MRQTVSGYGSIPGEVDLKADTSYIVEKQFSFPLLGSLMSPPALVRPVPIDD